MKLILNGGGVGEQIAASYKLFADIVQKNKVMYIPLAWENGMLEDCIHWFRKEMAPYGISDIDMVTKPQEITRERLKMVSGVFIGGGNTFKLLKMLKETNAFNNLIEFMKSDNKVIMGCSAGALIFGKSIDNCLKDEMNIDPSDENIVELKDTTGFNVINGYDIFAHYQLKPSQNKQTAQRINKFVNLGYKLICLPEETSLYVNNNVFKIIGQKSAIIVNKNGQKTLKPLTTLINQE